MNSKTISISLNKIYLFLLSIVFTSLVLLLPSLANAQTNSVTITSPNGGESYTVGDPVDITWSTSSTANCSIYYQTEESGPFTSYYVGNVSNASVESYSWTASVPDTTSEQVKIQMVCSGMPAEYSDNYFTISPVAQPTCDRPVQLSLGSTTQSAYRSDVVSNTLNVTNPNDSACGSKLYGISRSYPSGWTINIPYSVTVNPGATEEVGFDLTVASNAAYQSHDYSLLVGGSEGGVLVGVNGTVNVNPRCDLPVQASLSYSSHTAKAGNTINNNLVLTNPNIAECSPKTYIYSRGYPGGWNMTIQPNATVNSGETVSVPFDLTLASNATVGNHTYDFLVYNIWADGSGQTPVAGTVNVLENIAPTVSVSTPANNARVNKNKPLTINATASDNVGVSKVEFYVNNVLTCTDTTSAYACTFTTINQSGFAYILTAKAYDAANNTSTSSVSVITK